ncbi:hypothetical protein RM155_23900 (plasmid) [Pantoea agglomerans]|uniref:hypothetical protein n=1 Tax=Enterobacter agglomerans TaxID=549 RepID=UPI00289C7AC8|nr:hypothetical protein [Pantoea agglomerans]WNK74248.1 hypothetical protein RM155_23900 [Pantoea agglomerans]
MKWPAYLFCCTTMLTVMLPLASAATYEEASRLDDAYPPGSTEVCIQNLPGNGNNIISTRLEVRATVISRTAEHTSFRATAAWTPQGRTVPGLTLTYTLTQRKDEKGYYSIIDPASMSVTMPGAGPVTEKTVLEGMRQRLPAGEEFIFYSIYEITDFPSYVAHRPDEPVSYCHKEKQK